MAAGVVGAADDGCGVLKVVVSRNLLMAYVEGDTAAFEEVNSGTAEVVDQGWGTFRWYQPVVVHYRVWVVVYVIDFSAHYVNSKFENHKMVVELYH